MSTVQDNNQVKVHYTGTLSDGKVFDSSKDREPLAFTVGQGQMIPGFEKAVKGMALNEKKKVTIIADEAYGAKKDDMIQKVTNDQLPPDLKPHVDQELASQLPNGQQIVVKVTEVNDDHILIDANHPLAGEDLTFDIEVVEITE